MITEETGRKTIEKGYFREFLNAVLENKCPHFHPSQDPISASVNPVFYLYILKHWGFKLCPCRRKLSLKRRTPPCTKMIFRVPSMSSQQPLNAVTASAWIWRRQRRRAPGAWTSTLLQGKAALGEMGGVGVGHSGWHPCCLLAWM